MGFIKDKRIRTLIIIMSVLVAIGFLISKYYYQSVNESYDPRVVPAKKLYMKYNSYATSGDYEGLFLLLDSIEQIYGSYLHYKDSYETGVLYNNRAAALLTMALHKDSLVVNSRYFNNMSADTLFYMAQKAVERSIEIYENWLLNFESKSEEELIRLLQVDFVSGLENYSDVAVARFIKSRVQEMQEAQDENLRRLSVSYTNLGIIFRHNEQYELAVTQYKKAIDLWKRNLVAQNNLNILLGRPLKKQNLIQKLFPPSK